MRQKWIFPILLAILVYGLAEGMSFLLYGAVFSERYAFRGFDEGKAALPAEESPAGAPDDGTRGRASLSDEDLTKRRTLHPYLGYVLEPAFGVNSYGFHRKTLVRPAKGAEVVIAVTGGSLAVNFWRDSGALLLSKLKEIPSFQGERLRVISLGNYGYKEPQQLFAVILYLTLGGKLDMLINIDGYNEMHAVANARDHLNIAYPKRWPAISGAVRTPEYMRAIGEVVAFGSMRESLAREGRHLRFSATSNLVLRLIDRKVAAMQGGARARIAAIEGGGEDLPWFRTGPPNPEKPADIRRAAIDLWERSSVQLQRLARSNGFTYFHFLQPNQYVEGSKPFFTPAERTEQPNRQTVNGYADFLAAVPALRNEGVSFHDLTMIFRNVDEEVYRDRCCHLNQRGNDIMAGAIAAIIEKRLVAEGTVFTPGKNELASW